MTLQTTPLDYESLIKNELLALSAERGHLQNELDSNAGMTDDSAIKQALGREKYLMSLLKAIKDKDNISQAIWVETYNKDLFSGKNFDNPEALKKFMEETIKQADWAYSIAKLFLNEIDYDKLLQSWESKK